MRLEDGRFIVTGAAQGLGRHYALRLAEAGAQVAAGDVKEAELASLAEEAKGFKGKIHARKLNVADAVRCGGKIGAHALRVGKTAQVVGA